MSKNIEDKAPKKKRGRPKGIKTPHYDLELHKKNICNWISEGKTLRDYCRIEGNPSFRRVYEWMEEDSSFSARFAHSRDTGHDVIAQDCMAIADQEPTLDDNGKLDSGFVSWQKNRIWTRLQLLSKWNPKKYGERRVISGDSENPVAVTTITRKFIKPDESGD